MHPILQVQDFRCTKHFKFRIFDAPNSLSAELSMYQTLQVQDFRCTKHFKFKIFDVPNTLSSELSMYQTLQVRDFRCTRPTCVCPRCLFDALGVLCKRIWTLSMHRTRSDALKSQSRQKLYQDQEVKIT